VRSCHSEPGNGVRAQRVAGCGQFPDDGNRGPEHPDAYICKRHSEPGYADADARRRHAEPERADIAEPKHDHDAEPKPESDAEPVAFGHGACSGGVNRTKRIGNDQSFKRGRIAKPALQLRSNSDGSNEPKRGTDSDQRHGSGNLAGQRSPTWGRNEYRQSEHGAMYHSHGSPADLHSDTNPIFNTNANPDSNVWPAMIEITEPQTERLLPFFQLIACTSLLPTSSNDCYDPGQCIKISEVNDFARGMRITQRPTEGNVC